MALKTVFALLFLILIFISFAAPACWATEEFAQKTGLTCAFCHENPSGGGTLTVAGQKYLSQLTGKAHTLSTLQRYVRLVIGYLHILAGVVWFGAIFYIHIMLKPAYAAKGLPRGELILGWTGIIVVGVTGTLLTIAAIPSFHDFFATRFGMLLFIKIILYLIMALSAAFVTFIIGPKLRKRIAAKSSPAPSSAEEGNMKLTPETLSSYDGKEGQKAYAAVDGIIYDVTDSRMWKNGKHARHFAGMDLSSSLKQAPHGPEKLEAFTKVGALLPSSVAGRGARREGSLSEGPGERAGSKVPGERPKIVFYFMAYMNLAIIFLVLAVIALWRWWP
jgi:predicted heme/steroid binding protein/uncharacterized membrane protein